MLENNCEVFEVVSGRREEDKIFNSKLAGYGSYCEEGHYFIFRLNMFPRNRYYLTRNKDSHQHYTIYTKILKTPEGVKLLDPVGNGHVPDDAKTFVNLNFLLFPKANLYLSLFPRG